MSTLIVGATGTIGSEIIRSLEAKNALNVVALVRDVEKARTKFGDKIMYVHGSLVVEADVHKALQGVERVALAVNMDPKSYLDEIKFIKACIAAGVKQLVYLSAIGSRASSGPQSVLRWHAEVEDFLFENSSKLAYSVLRPGFFFQGYLGETDAIKAGKIVRPHDLPVSLSDTRDVGLAFATILTEPIQKHSNKLYYLPTVALRNSEVAAIVSKAVGHPVKSEIVDEVSFYAQFAQLPAFVADFLLDLFISIRINPEMQISYGHFKIITGQEPRSMEAFFEENKQVFSK